MELARINVVVPIEAKQVLLDYQKEKGIRDQGNALTQLLIELKERNEQ